MTVKVAAALNATDVTTFFGHIKFTTDPGHHGLQTAHEMVLLPAELAAKPEIRRAYLGL